MNNIVIIGSFESFHNGHYKLYKKAKKIKGNINFLIINLLNDISSYFYDIDSRKEILSQLANTYIYDLDIQKNNVEAETFINILKDQYNADKIIVGSDFRFGRGRKGDITLLKKHFSVSTIKLSRFKISTSKISILLKKHNIKKANKLLYNKFFIKSEVVQGNQLARQLGYPTINFMLDKKQVCPGKGVYYTSTTILNIKYNSITFISDYSNKNKVETHILNFNSTLYGQKIEVEFNDFIRLPVKYSGKDSIIKQIKEDIKKIKC